MYYVRLSIANLAVSIGKLLKPSLRFMDYYPSMPLPPPPQPSTICASGRLTSPDCNKTEREKLVSLGICLGKFTKSGKFRLHITSLPILAEHARYKIWVKPNGEMPFLYGGNIVKAHVGRWSEDCPEHQGVIVYSMNDTPLGVSTNGVCFDFLTVYRVRPDQRTMRLTTLTSSLELQPAARRSRADLTPRASPASGRQTAASTCGMRIICLRLVKGGRWKEGK